MVDVLVDVDGIALDTADKHGATPFFVAAERDNLECVIALGEAGALVDLPADGRSNMNAIQVRRRIVIKRPTGPPTHHNLPPCPAAQYAAVKNKLETIKTVINLGTCDSSVKDWVYHVDATCRPELQRWAAASLLMPAEEVLTER